MPIWIKYQNNLILCDVLSIGTAKDDGTCSLYAYPSGSGADGPVISIKGLTNQQANGIMREIVTAVASGKTYYEIKD